jgi:GTP-binding protein HflX
VTERINQKGFVMDLPHEMIPAFMTTLEHIKTADLVLHVRDISHPQTQKMDQTVREVVAKLDMHHLFEDSSKYIGKSE